MKVRVVRGYECPNYEDEPLEPTTWYQCGYCQEIYAGGDKAEECCKEIQMLGMTECKVCLRLHDDDQPCSARVARAYMMLPKALEELTEADKKWISTNTVDVLDILEEELSNSMEISDTNIISEEADGYFSP